ncbi:MAG: NAD-dependent epimerase/dehydratase family protein [Nitrospirota bacterium]
MKISLMSEEKLSSIFRGEPVLITGANGFTAGYLVRRLTALGAIIYGLDIHAHQVSQDYIYYNCDLTSLDKVISFVDRSRPKFVFHLASKSSVGSSWVDEWDTIENNVKSTYNLLKALEIAKISTKLILISSGEVYGYLGNKKAAVTDQLRPMNPYATSKAMMEMAVRRFQNTEIACVIARAYNHTGPKRPEVFFEAGVAAQFARAKKEGRDSVHLKVGNVENIRDFSDVRDVVEKYLYLACQGSAGEVYNVCSGVGRSLREIISMLEKISQIKAYIDIDPARLRKNDIPFLVGENSIMIADRPMEDTLRDLYQYVLENYRDAGE